MNHAYTTMREIGKLFGGSNHDVGRWLVEIGLRTSGKTPSQRAFDGGYVEQAPLDHCDGYFYTWHRERTIAALEAAGHQRVDRERPTSLRLVGPFTAQKSGQNGSQIVSGDGTVSVWAYGDETARTVVGLLNRAYEQGTI